MIRKSGNRFSEKIMFKCKEGGPRAIKSQRVRL
jgi:hypothetical protein